MFQILRMCGVFVLAGLLAGLLAGPGFGQTAPALSDAAKRRMADKPAQALEAAATLIYGYGSAGRLGAAGIERYIALERARIRAREVARLLKADLDGDGQVIATELAALQAISTPGTRGRLQLAFRAADGDNDGQVATGELQAHARRAALKELNARDARDLHGLLSFDRDGDGAVTLDDIAAALERMAPRT